MNSFNPVQIMYAAAMFFAGWLCFYLFIKLVFFAFFTAFPLFKKMNSVKEVISPTVKKFCILSTVIYFLIAAGLIALVTWLCRNKLYLNICFYAGLLVCFLMYINKFSYTNREMFDKFIMTYYSFILDDELRTHTYNKDLDKMRQRCRLMEVNHDWIPVFDKKK